MKNATQVLIEHYEQQHGRTPDEATLENLKFAVNAIEDHSDQFRYVRTTCGKQVLCDDKDYKFLRDHSLFLRKGRGDILMIGKTEEGKKTSIIVAKALLKLKGKVVIHYSDGNKLNLKRENISGKSHQKAHFARKIPKHNKSGFKGVSMHKSGKFIASIRVDKKNHHIGYFATKEDAALAYNQKAIEHYGKDYAYLNSVLPKI